MAAMRLITFRKVAGDILVEVDGEPSMSGLARLELETGDSLQIAHDLRDAVLGSVRPSQSALDEGGDLAVTHEALPNWLYEAPYDTGVLVNGEHYVWFMIHGSEARLLPLAFAAKSVRVGRLNAWQSGSMAGADINAECWWLSPVCFVSYVEVDSGNPPWLDFDYTCLDPTDHVLTLPRLLEWGADRTCGECGDDGWVITVEVADPVPVEVVGQIMAEFWQPCQAHSQTWQIDMADRSWNWDGTTWIPEPPD